MSNARGGARAVPPSGGRAGGEEAAPVSALEVVSFLGKLLCAVAALKAALYLIRRVCLAMAWKSGGASHSELIHNLRSECVAVGARAGAGKRQREGGARARAVHSSNALTHQPTHPEAVARE